jgi:hypothetical protein
VQEDPLAGGRFLPEPSDRNRKTEWMADLANNTDSLPGELGLAGALALVAALAVGRGRRSQERGGGEGRYRPERAAAGGPGGGFWLLLYGLGIPLSIALFRAYSPHGLAHENLQAFVCFAAVFLVSRLRRAPAAVRAFLFAGFLVESAVVTGARIALEERRVPIVIEPDGTFTVTGKLGFHPNYVRNHLYKLREDAVFLSDRLGDLAGPFAMTAAALAVALLAMALLHGPKVRGTPGGGTFPGGAGPNPATPGRSPAR